MKKVFIATLLLITVAFGYAISVQRLLMDFKQNRDARRRYRAVRLLSKKQYIPVLNDFTNSLVIDPRGAQRRDGRITKLKIVIARNLRHYAGVPYDKLKHPISIMLRYIEQAPELEVLGDLFISLAIIMKKNGIDFHKVFLTRRIKTVLKKVKMMAKRDPLFRSKETLLVNKAVIACTILKTNEAENLLGWMLNFGYRNYTNNKIRAALKKFR